MRMPPLYADLLKYTDITSAARISLALARKEKIFTRQELLDFVARNPLHHFDLIGKKYEKILECVIDGGIEIPAERLEMASLE